MMKKKPVKALMGESLEELLKIKPFEKITVNEIVENCGVGRRSFYNNFADKYDLAAWVYINQLHEFVESRDSIRLTDFIKYTAEVVAKDLQMIIALDKYRGQNSLRDSLLDPMTDLYIKVLEKYCSCEPDAQMVQDIKFFVAGQISYIGRIISDPVVPSPEEATELFIRCIPESMRRFI
jgi:AcrR family transcriptional regulator